MRIYAFPLCCDGLCLFILIYDSHIPISFNYVMADNHSSWPMWTYVKFTSSPMACVEPPLGWATDISRCYGLYLPILLLHIIWWPYINPNWWIIFYLNPDVAWYCPIFDLTRHFAHAFSLCKAAMFLHILIID